VSAIFVQGSYVYIEVQTDRLTDGLTVGYETCERFVDGRDTAVIIDGYDATNVDGWKSERMLLLDVILASKPGYLWTPGI
jgi:hypothetical protein